MARRSCAMMMSLTPQKWRRFARRRPSTSTDVDSGYPGNARARFDSSIGRFRWRALRAASRVSIDAEIEAIITWFSERGADIFEEFAD
eukprot:9782571-Lingulodinium_polyedra.AAC.1